MYLYVMEHFYFQCSSMLNVSISSLSFLFIVYYLFKKNTDIFMFSFGWLKRDWWLYECCLQRKLFYLGNVSRKNLLLAVNFQSDALRDLVLFLQFRKREKHQWKSITFSKVSLQLYSKWHFSIVVFHVFKIVQMAPNRANHLIYFQY